MATDELCIPYRKRLMYSYATDDAGARTLRLDYGVKEVVFDDERLFAFAEQLGAHASFEARTALGWGPGYTWDEVQPLLDALVDEGILSRGREPNSAQPSESRLPPAVCPHVRTWTATDCEALTQELAGRPVEIGYLESIVPAFRVAHPALDADGRQVGEANVYPPRLRIDRVTEWRVCQYAGSRYRDAAPMNVTALKAMIRHWKPILVAVARLRATLRERLGPRSGPWTIGELHTLACVALALPAFQLQRGEVDVVDPVVSSMFRLVDGVRMTTDDMMFGIGRSHPADEPLTAAQLWGFAERYSLLLGDTGVCAGPQPMVDEFLAVIVDGSQPPDATLSPEIAALLERAAAIDYGLYGLQAQGVSLALWLAMARAYEAIHDLLARKPELASRALHERLATDWQVLEGMQLARDDHREVHRLVYVDMYERPRRALPYSGGRDRLTDELAGVRSPGHAALAAALRARWSVNAPPEVDALVNAFVTYSCEEQAVLASATRIQRELDRLLDRPQPTRSLEGRDLAVRFALPSSAARFPYLFDLLELELGVHLRCTATTLELRDVRTP